MILFLTKKNLGKELKYVIYFSEVWGKLIKVSYVPLGGKKKNIKIHIVI